MRDPNNPCLFCNVLSSDYVLENNLAFSTFDSYPVSKHHALIIPKRHVENYFDMSDEEVLSCNNLIKKMRSDKIEKVLGYRGKDEIIHIDDFVLEN